MKPQNRFVKRGLVVAGMLLAFGCNSPSSDDDPSPDLSSSSSMYSSPMANGEERPVTLDEGAFKGENVTLIRIGDIVYIKGTTTVIHDYSAKEVTEEEAVVEEEIANIVANAVNPSLVDLFDDIGSIWPNREIKYHIDNYSSKGVTDDQKNLIENVLNYWESKTSVRFKDSGPFFLGKRILFVTSSDKDAPCSSMVGRRDVRFNTRVYLAETCNYNTIVHEVGHAIGMIHTHQRADRDDYVKVYIEDVLKADKDNEHNIVTKRTSKGSLKHQWGVYDYFSVMHYGCLYYDSESNNNEWQIQPLRIDEKYCDQSSRAFEHEPFIGKTDNLHKEISQGDTDWVANYYTPVSDPISLIKFTVNDGNHFSDTTHIEFEVEASSTLSSITEVCLKETYADLPAFPLTYCYDYRADFNKVLDKKDLYIMQSESYGLRYFEVTLKNASGKSVTSESIELDYVAELPMVTWYRDQDGDNFGNSDDSVEATYQPEGYVIQNNDWDDEDSTVHPGATELCDKKDNDQDSDVDEGVNCDWPEPPFMFNAGELLQFKLSKGSLYAFTNWVSDPNCDLKEVRLYKRQMPYPGFVHVSTTSVPRTCDALEVSVYYRFRYTNSYQMYIVAIDHEDNESEKKYWNGTVK